jgi:hypothetical protein
VRLVSPYYPKCERDTAMTAIVILTNTEHPTRHLYTNQIYYGTKPSKIWNRYKKKWTHPNLRKTWMRIASILYLQRSPKDQEVGSGGRLREKYERHEKIYTDGSKKNERAGYAVITPNRTYRRRVNQQSTVFSTEQEAIIKAIWLKEGTQRDKVIITESLSTLTMINGINHTKNPKTIKLREMMDRLKKTDNTPVGTRTHWHTRKRTSTWGSKGSAGWRHTTKRRIPPKDLEKWLKTETTKIRKEQWSRPLPMGLHRNWTEKSDDDDTRNKDKRSRRNEKDHRIYKKIGFYDGIYEKQMNKKTQKSLLQILSQKPTSSQTKNILS